MFWRFVGGSRKSSEPESIESAEESTGEGDRLRFLVARGAAEGWRGFGFEGSWPEVGAGDACSESNVIRFASG